MFATESGLVLKPPVAPVLEAYHFTLDPYSPGQFTTMVINPPTGIVAGELLFIMASIYSQANDNSTWTTIQTAPGWTEMSVVTSPRGSISYTLMYKVADGTEGAVTCTLNTLQQAVNAGSYYCRISGANLTNSINSIGVATGTLGTVLSIPQFNEGPVHAPLDFLFAVSNGHNSDLQISAAGYTQHTKDVVLNYNVGHEIAFGMSTSTTPGDNNVTTVAEANIGGVQVSFANA